MAAALDFSNFTFTTEQIRRVNELVFDQIIKAPEFSSYATIFPGIKSGKEVGFIGDGGLAVTAAQGCDPTPQDWQAGTRKITWTPATLEVFLKQCYADLEATAAVYSLHTGVKIAAFTDTDYMAIVAKVLVESIKKGLARVAWFGDTAAENVTDGGVITNGVSVDFFTPLDGLWKQAYTQAAGHTSQLVTISENSGATYTAQALLASNIIGYLEALVYGAPVQLRAQEGVILCTQSFADAYAKTLQAQSAGIFYNMGQYNAAQNGVPQLMYNGIEVVAVPFFDEIIRSCQDNGAAWNLPHRALYTTKANIGIGFDGEGAGEFEQLSVWDEKKDKAVYVDVMGKMDAKILNPSLLMLAI